MSFERVYMRSGLRSSVRCDPGCASRTTYTRGASATRASPSQSLQARPWMRRRRAAASESRIRVGRSPRPPLRTYSARARAAGLLVEFCPRARPAAWTHLRLRSHRLTASYNQVYQENWELTPEYGGLSDVRRSSKRGARPLLRFPLPGDGSRQEQLRVTEHFLCLQVFESVPPHPDVYYVFPLDIHILTKEYHYKKRYKKPRKLWKSHLGRAPPPCQPTARARAPLASAGLQAEPRHHTGQETLAYLRSRFHCLTASYDQFFQENW
jgi:hypothetical protein